MPFDAYDHDYFLSAYKMARRALIGYTVALVLSLLGASYLAVTANPWQAFTAPVIILACNIWLVRRRIIWYKSQVDKLAVNGDVK